MAPEQRFRDKPQAFWACVRTISQHVGYGRANEVIAPTHGDMLSTFRDLNLAVEQLERDGTPTQLAKDLDEYFRFRRTTLMETVQHQLMDVNQARTLFMRERARLKPSRPVPMNKQKGDKRAEAYLTGLVNMIVEAHIGDLPCDYDPSVLTTFTRRGVPVRTLARRVDGAFPSPVNPIAIWEIKEYYYTTTFGSRVADGVYETLLDGMELKEMRDGEGIECAHLLIIDAHYTWWVCGKSYLCRIIDMLHMGYCDEVLFGREVVERLPSIVKGWVDDDVHSHRQRQEPSLG